ncbi:unnamed protein product [Leptidea sinapis]|uniref:Uncharacterized protein n=1 Tax=Leptidea sinapis TaxID=189913 RepID=A0A5E4QK68_9NEOP|nr:unnamed protein product [Leptidea sinapis]
MRSALLDGDTDSYDMECGYTRHTISDARDNPGIIVRLPTTTIINHVRLLLWDRDNRSWQVINFPARPVSIIRVVGTNNSVNEVFHLVHLECPSQVTVSEELDEQQGSKKQRAIDDRPERSSGAIALNSFNIMLLFGIMPASWEVRSI